MIKAATAFGSTFTLVNRVFGQLKLSVMIRTGNRDYLIRSVHFAMSPRNTRRRYYFTGTTTRTFLLSNPF